MKKKLCSILCVLLVLSMMIVPCTFAAENIKVLVNGNEVWFDVPPQTIQYRTMVPVRHIFEALGAKVAWDEPTQTATATRGSDIVAITIGVPKVFVNGKAREMDVSAVEIGGRILIPARFAAEAFGCDVGWDEATQTVSITGNVSVPKSQPVTTVTQTQKPQTTTQTQPTNTVEKQTLGTRENPYSCTSGELLEYNKYSFYPVRKVRIKCNNIISGSEANNLAHSENRFNDEPNANQEWRFYEFEIEYFSSNGGSDDELKGSDIIFVDRFFKKDGSSVQVADTATLGDRYYGYGIFDAKMYPGSSATVVIGILIEKNAGDLLLKVPYNEGKSNSWILLDKPGTSKISTQTSKNNKQSSSTYSWDDYDYDDTYSYSDFYSKQNVFDFMVDYCKKNGVYKDGMYQVQLNASAKYTSITTLQYSPSKNLVSCSYGVQTSNSSGTLTNITLIGFTKNLSKPYTAMFQSSYSGTIATQNMEANIYPSSVSNNGGKYLPPITKEENIYDTETRSLLQESFGLGIQIIITSLDVYVLLPNGYSVADLGFTNF